jgi:hypothetical protein
MGSFLKVEPEEFLLYGRKERVADAAVTGR